MSITFTNKHLLTDRGFEFPFSLSMATNAFVFLLVFASTRAKSLRPPSMPWDTVVRVVGPIGVLTALDIGCSNWALVHLSVALHTIIRGTVPAFVLCFSMMLGLDQPSWLIGLSVGVVVVGCGLAAYAEIECDVFGLALALLSCVFSGLRWALTQLLVHMGKHTITRGGGDGSAGGSNRHTRDEARRALDRSASPLSAMFYVTPACAIASGAAAFIMERHNVAISPYLLRSRLRYELCWYVGATGTLVFILLFCEFGLVRLTSSLSLSVFGVLKELITIILASKARGDQITLTNISGFVLCSAGILLYQTANGDKRGRTGKGEITDSKTERNAELPVTSPPPPAARLAVPVDSATTTRCSGHAAPRALGTSAL